MKSILVNVFEGRLFTESILGRENDFEEIAVALSHSNTVQSAVYFTTIALLMAK